MTEREKKGEAARSEVARLEKVGTAEALGCGKERRQDIRLGSVKNRFDGIVGKVLPELGIGDKPAASGDVK